MNFGGLWRAEGSSIASGSGSLFHTLQTGCVLICGGIFETGAVGENLGSDIALQCRTIGTAKGCVGCILMERGNIFIQPSAI